MNLFKPQYDYIEAGQAKAPQFPLYSYLVALLYKIFGFHESLGRILSAFFSALSAGFLYLLAGRFLDEKSAFLSGLAFCFIPLRIYFMRAFMPEAMAIFCLLAGFYFFVRSISDDSSPFDGIVSLLFLTLVPLLKVAYLWLLIVPILYVWKQKGLKCLLTIKFAASFAFVFLTVGGWYLYSNYGVKSSGDFAGMLIMEMSIFKVWRDPAFWSVHFLSRFPELLTTYGGLIFFVGGFYVLVRERRHFFVIWFGATVLYILLCGQYGRIHQYVSLPFAPVNAVFIGSGMAFFLEKWRHKRTLIILWLCLAVSIPVHAALRIKHWYRLDDVWMSQAKAISDQNSLPNDLFFINSPNEPFFLYHLHRKGWVSPLAGKGLEFFDQALKSGARFLFVPLHETGMDWELSKSQYEKRYSRVYSGNDFEIYDLRKVP